jgi:hypothetical protein
VELEQGTTPTGKQPQDVGGKLSPGRHCEPGGQTPLHCGKVAPHALGTVVVVLVVVVLVVVAQPPATQASQQLVNVPTHASPPGGAAQADARGLMLHRVAPLLLDRQQVTAPGRPQVERAAHRRTAPLHWGRRRPPTTRIVVTAETQLTYWPWLAAPAQLQSAAICARASATACASPGSSPQATSTDGARLAWTRSAARATRARMRT